MSNPFVGEIRLFAFNFPPYGWAFCDGQTMPISQYAAVFSILGVTYGGNGLSNFNLPDFRGKAPIHYGDDIIIGQSGGENSHTLSIQEVPAHNHIVGAIDSTGTSSSPSSLLAEPAANSRYTSLYATSGTLTQLDPRTVQYVGSTQPHENRQPSLVLNFSIALSGVFPSRS